MNKVLDWFFDAHVSFLSRIPALFAVSATAILTLTFVSWLILHASGSIDAPFWGLVLMMYL